MAFVGKGKIVIYIFFLIDDKVLDFILQCNISDQKQRFDVNQKDGEKKYHL